MQISAFNQSAGGEVRRQFLTLPICFAFALATAAYTSSAAAADTAADITSTPVALAGLAEGVSLQNGTVAMFTDLHPGNVADYTALISWGDGTVSAGNISASGAGSFRVNGTHTFAEEGDYTYRTDISYHGLTAVGIGMKTTVSDAALSLLFSPATISFSEGVASSQVWLAAFGDALVLSPASDFTATVDWGDGLDSAASVTETGSGKFALDASHTYASDGTFSILINIRDEGGSSLRTSTTAIVTSVPEPSDLVLLSVGLFGLARRVRAPSHPARAARWPAKVPAAPRGVASGPAPQTAD